MIKRFKDINENTHSDIDPFEEEKWGNDAFDINKVEVLSSSEPSMNWDMTLQHASDTEILVRLYKDWNGWDFVILNDEDLDDEIYNGILYTNYEYILNMLRQNIKYS